MCGGGGGMKAPDPMVEAQAEIKRMQEQYKIDQQRAVAAAKTAADTEAAGRKTWQTDLGTSRTQALKAITNQFKGAGLDSADYMDRINAALDLEQAGKSYGGSTGFSKDIGTGVMGDVRNSTIRDYNKAINTYAPEGFEQKAFADTSDDAVLAAILGEQFSGASDSIMRAHERGTLNDQGYKYAMDNLNTQKSAGNARLQSLGGGVLEGYPKQLGDIAKGARTGASSWDFGDTFDPNTYGTQLTGRQKDLSGRLEGDIRSAVGGEQFFNIDDLISKGTVGQGAVNGNPTSLAGAIAGRKKEEEEQRGLGTQGSF